MCPGDVVVRLFYAVAGGGIIKHDFTIANVALGVYLPEDGGAGPVFGGTDKIGIDEFGDCRLVENGGKPGDEMIVRVVGEGGLED